MVGDAVNLAARLADASEAGKIIVGPAARRLAGPGFVFAESAPMVLKGKAEPVPVSRLECSDAPGEPAAASPGHVAAGRPRP